MKQINGATYSRQQFDGYELRLTLELRTKTNTHKVDIYTNQKDITVFTNDVRSILSADVIQFEIIRYSTRSTDNMNKEFINKLLGI